MTVYALFAAGLLLGGAMVAIFSVGGWCDKEMIARDESKD